VGYAFADEFHSPALTRDISIIEAEIEASERC
jgi:hypothetical protein